MLLLALRLGGGRAGRGLVACWVSLFRNTPLLVQLLFWYFAARNLLPLTARDFINADHARSILPGNVWWLTPEFLCSMWGWGIHLGVSGRRDRLRAARRQPRSARSRLCAGFYAVGRTASYSAAAGLANARQPIIGQYLNLMKLSSLASGIGFAELTYRAANRKL